MSELSPGRWVDRAACYGMGKLFTLPATGNIRRRGRQGTKLRLQIDRAKAVCDGCSVFDECHAWATSTPDPAFSMVAAGMTPTERHEWRRRLSTVAG